MDKDKREYFIYVKGKAVPVSEEVYKAYWKITEHERYLQRKDWKYDVIPFSAMNYDGHFVDNIIDERVDLEKKDIKTIRRWLSLHLLTHINPIVFAYLVKLVHRGFGGRILLHEGILFFLQFIKFI